MGILKPAIRIANPSVLSAVCIFVRVFAIRETAKSKRNRNNDITVNNLFVITLHYCRDITHGRDNKIHHVGSAWKERNSKESTSKLSDLHDIYLLRYAIPLHKTEARRETRWKLDIGESIPPSSLALLTSV